MSTSIAESSPDVIASFLQELIVEYHQFGVSHRRTEPRECVAVPVQVQCLDRNLQPAGAPFPAITRDISFGGIGLFHSQPIKLRYLFVTLKAPHSHQQMRLLATVEHCTPCGGFFIVGCRFAQRGDATYGDEDEN